MLQNNTWKKVYFDHNIIQTFALSGSRILTLVGAGGKTSLMNALGKEYAALSHKTLITTTTHIMRPDFLSEEAIIETENIGAVDTAFHKSNLLALGIPCHQKQNKWQSPSLSFFREIAHLPDIILCEGDGSKRLPVKIPREGEPVFYPGTDTVLGVIGLSCLHQPVAQCMFGLNQKKEEIWKKRLVTPELLLEIALSNQGLKKNVSSESFHVILNQADLLTASDMDAMIKVGKKIRDNGAYCHIVSLKYNYFLDFD